MSAINATGAIAAESPLEAMRRKPLTLPRMLPIVVFAAIVIGLVFSAGQAFAGQASTGELLYYPCDTCHPIIDGAPAKKLPNDFKGHEIVLVGHDVLGKGKAACLVCHDDPSRNPGMLKLIDGSLIPVTGDVSQVCYRCHSAKYKEFKAGTHGKHKPACTAAGCHDPHTPRWIYAPPLLPFVGTGFQVQVLSDRQAFRALAPPPQVPLHSTPGWFLGVVAFGLVTAGSLAGWLVQGRSKR